VRRAVEQFPDVRFINGYGPTENTTFTCCHVIGREDVESGRAITIGRPIANTSVYVLDRDGRPAPIGVPGELVAGGDGIALGYAGQPAQTAKSFVPDTLSGHTGGRLYRTGDRVRLRADGNIEFLGRFDEQVKIRGHRIEPGEIAACLAEHAEVRQAAVVPRVAPSGARRLIAYVVAQGAESATELPRILAAHTAARLPAYMLPATFVIVAKLPLKPNGKLDVEVLARAGQRPVQESQLTPLTPTQTKMLAIWRDILRHPDLGADDDFFEAGGDSLLAVRMLARVERELGTQISVRALVEGRTLRHIAAMLTDSLPSSLPRGVVRLRGSDAERPLFCLPGLGGVALQFERMAAIMSTQRTVYAIGLHELEIEPAVLESLVDTAGAIVRCMRAVQAHGPYSILGYSYGGNLAVEVARELVLQGQQVALVAVLDAYAPGSARDPRGLSKVATHLRILARLRLGEARDYLLPRILRRLRLKAPEQEPERPLPGSDFERRLADAEERGARAFRSYHPTPFDGRIVLVHATDLNDWMEIVDPSGTLGWGAICKGGVDVIQIGCKHLDLFKEPNITELAHRLDELL
jgi:thioesterase domain-containing protein/acyl carrier protein